MPRKNRDVFRGASLGVFRAFFEKKTLKDAQRRSETRKIEKALFLAFLARFFLAFLARFFVSGFWAFLGRFFKKICFFSVF